MKKYIKYYSIRLACIMPTILGILFCLYVALREPYVSNLYYIDGTFVCSNCDKILSTSEQFCTKCGENVAEVAETVLYKHCEHCTDNRIYRNSDTTFCKKCGSELTLEHTESLKLLGFSDFKQFNKARFNERLNRLLNNKILLIIITVILMFIIRSSIKQFLKKKVLQKIINDSINK